MILCQRKSKNLYYVLFSMNYDRIFLNSATVAECMILAAWILNSAIVKFMILAPRASDSAIAELMVSRFFLPDRCKRLQIRRP